MTTRRIVLCSLAVVLLASLLVVWAAWRTPVPVSIDAGTAAAAPAATGAVVR